MRIGSNANFLSRFQNKARITIFSIPNSLNKSASSAFRPALSNLWLLLVVTFFPLVKSNERQMNCFAALPLSKKIFWDHFLGELRNQAWIGSRAFSSQYRKGTLLVYFDGERVVSKAIMTRKGKCYFGSLASIITNCLYFKPCLKCLEVWLVLLCNLGLVTQWKVLVKCFSTMISDPVA